MKKKTRSNKYRSSRKVKRSKRVKSFKIKRKTRNKSRKTNKFSNRKRKSKSKMKGGVQIRRTTALAPVAGTFTAILDNIRTKDNKILIMGAGPVGLFTAYYLLKHYPDTHIVLGELRKLYNRNQVINIDPKIISRKNEAGEYVIDDELLTEFITFGCKHYNLPWSFRFSDKAPSIPDRDSSLARLRRNPIRDISHVLPPNFRGPDQPTNSTQIPFTGDQTRCVEPKHEGKNMAEMMAYYREEGNNLSLSLPINAIQIILTRLISEQRYSDRFDFLDFYDISKEGYEIPQIIDMLADLEFPIIIPNLGIQNPTVADQPVAQADSAQGGGSLPPPDEYHISTEHRGAGANRALEDERDLVASFAAVQLGGPKPTSSGRNREAIDESLDRLCGIKKFRQNIKEYDWWEGKEELDQATKPKLKYGFITTVKLKPGSEKSYQGSNMLTENEIKDLLRVGWLNFPQVGHRSQWEIRQKNSEMYGCSNPTGFCYYLDAAQNPENQSYARLFPKNKKLKEKQFREELKSLGREYISPHSGELYLGIVAEEINMTIDDLRIRFIDALQRYGVSLDSIDSFHGGSFGKDGMAHGFPIKKYKPDLSKLPIVLKPRVLEPLVLSVDSVDSAVQNEEVLPLRQTIEAMKNKETIVYFTGDSLYPHHFFTGSGVGIGFIQSSLIIDFLMDFSARSQGGRAGRFDSLNTLKDNLHAKLEELWHLSGERTDIVAHAYGEDPDRLVLPLITKADIEGGPEAYFRKHGVPHGRAHGRPHPFVSISRLFNDLEKSGQIPVYGEISEYSEEGIYTKEPLLDGGIDMESGYQANDIDVNPAEIREGVQWYKVTWISTDVIPQKYEVYRRYNDFKWLRDNTFNPTEGLRDRVWRLPFPEGKLFHRKGLVDERADQLKDFLSKVLSIFQPEDESYGIFFKFLTQGHWELHQGGIGYDSHQ